MKNKNYQALTATDDALKIMRKFFRDEKSDRNARNVAKTALMQYLVKTDDGSYTFNSNIREDKSETMHTHHGAITESMLKYIKPAKLEGKKKVRVLDICSGLGYNAASCIEFLDDEVTIEMDLVEISRETLAMTLFIENPLKSYRIIKKAVEDKLYQEGIINNKFYQNEQTPDGIDINLHLDDARNVVKEIGSHKKYDAIFLDAFSPLKSPELYSQEFILILRNLLEDNGAILTYTSAAPVRTAMVQSDLHVGEGPSFGRSGGTIASKNPAMIEKPLSANDERMIALSDAGISFKDPDLTDDSYSILQRRTLERESMRGKKKFASTVKTPVYFFKDLEAGRLKRRVLKNLRKMGFDDLNSFKSRYVVCPQYNDCICGKECKNFNNSRERINEMSRRLMQILEDGFIG